MSDKEAEASRWWYCYSVTVHTVYTALVGLWLFPAEDVVRAGDCRLPWEPELVSPFTRLVRDWWFVLFGVWGSVWLVFHRPWPFLLISLSNNDNSSTAQWLPLLWWRAQLSSKKTLVSTCLSHSAVGALFRDFTKASSRTFVLSGLTDLLDGFVWTLFELCGLVACFWLMFDDVLHHLVFMATASLTPLFSWLKGAPPGTYPSSR